MADPRTNFSATDSDGYTALHLAAWMGHTETVKALLRDPRTNPNAVNNKKGTALHSAALAGYTKAARALLADHRTNQDAINSEGMTALQVAIQHNHEQVKFEILYTALYKSFRRSPIVF